MDMYISEEQLQVLIDRAVEKATTPLLVHIAKLEAHIVKQEARIVELEARLALNSRNSGKPPSSDGLSKPSPKPAKKPSGKKTGGQPGHKGTTLAKVSNPDHVVPHMPPETCDACQSVLPEATLASTRQVFDLPPTKLDVTEHQVFQAICTCGKIHQGQFPDGVKQPVQYGPRIKATAVYLTQHHMLPLARTGALLNAFFKAPMSDATILAACEEAVAATGPLALDIQAALRVSPVLHADETGMRCNGNGHWVHVTATQLLTWLRPHPKRGKGIGEGSILGDYRGVCVHDCLEKYFTFDYIDAICNAHIVRELVFIHEQMNQRWAHQMERLLWAAWRDVNRHNGLLPRKLLGRYHALYEKLIDKGKAQNPDPPRVGKRGRLKRTKAGNLLIRLEKHKDAIWRFATVKEVPFSNNVAEQAVRMPKVKQKVAGCFRTFTGLENFCRIRSFCSTMDKQNINPLDGLIRLLQGEPLALRWA